MKNQLNIKETNTNFINENSSLLQIEEFSYFQTRLEPGKNKKINYLEI
jgi:hypothetical protein